MGVTQFDIQLIEKALKIKPDIKSVMQLGSQNNYTTTAEKPPFMSEWFRTRGIECDSIDLAGDDGAFKIDMSHPFPIEKEYDLVTDFGTGEHIVQMEGYESVAFHEGHINSIYPTKVKDIDAGYYYGWSNKHNLLKVGGIIINVNPKTGHWPEHCYSYLTWEFYKEFIKYAGYEIIELGENCALGNCDTGINVYCIMKKTSERFPNRIEFTKLPVYRQ